MNIEISITTEKTLKTNYMSIDLGMVSQIMVCAMEYYAGLKRQRHCHTYCHGTSLRYIFKQKKGRKKYVKNDPINILNLCVCMCGNVQKTEWKKLF